ncbi:hypothetical protein NST33_18325 [Paenibacillus sp. FSL L8-0435]|uniref:hypothetical protein n=1 Tax=Paenibacillus sp. FSL L8-0435 TaxID=2954618 RepID=UPI0030D8F2D3
MNSKYTMSNGKVIEVGKQNFADGSVTVRDGDKKVKCRLWQDDGEINFMYEGEEVYFKDLKS